MGIGSALGVLNTTTRHMLDANVTFGMSSSRFNARDRYRRSYSDAERAGAGIGTALGLALPASAGVAWVRRGMPVLGTSPGLTQTVGRVAGLAALGLATGVGVQKTWEIAQDDGHLGAVGAATGVIAGTAGGLLVGRAFAGKYAPLVSGAGAIIGGIAGHAGGSRIRIGESRIGTEYVQAPQVDATAGDRVGSFARGAFNHFNEVGPTTQGISFGYRWGMQDAVRTKYSNAERAGAMHGDLLAAGILGGGALAMIGTVAGLNRSGPSGVAAGANVAGHVLGQGALTGAMQKLGTKGAAGVAAAGIGIAAAVASKEFDRARDAGDSTATAAAWAGGVLAATVGTAALVSRTGALRSMAAAPRAASSTLIAAALIGVLSSARLPVQQFINDASSSTTANGGVRWSVAAPVGGVAAAAGAVGAFRALNRLVPASGVQLGTIHLPKAAVVAAGAGISALASGGVGVGLSSTMPDLKTVGMSAAAGAVAGAAAGGFARGIGVVPGILGGAALGATASSLLREN